MDMVSDLFVSVIVPVYRSLSMLQPCLEALEHQSYSAYEVIVIDNGSNDGIELLCKSYPKVRLHRHEKPGSYSSRNAGIAVAKGDIIALTDADCIPCSDWILNGVNGLRRNSCKMGGGPILPHFAHEHTPSIIELCDVILHTMNQEQSLEECTSVACANMFVHRSLFDTIGLFDGALFSAGDCEFTYRARTHGEKIVVLDNAVVHHRARRTLPELSQRYRRFAGAEFRSKVANDPNDTVSHLQSLSFRYRVKLCIRNIYEGTRRYRKERHPMVLVSALLLVEGYITAVKTVEYVRLSLGMPMQR